MPGEETGPLLVTLALQAFGCAIERPDKIVEQYHSYCSQKGKHLLDLLRTSFIHPNLLERPPKARTALKVIRCVSKLRRAGIKFKHSSNATNIVRNTSQIMLVSWMINTFKDVEFLFVEGVIENYFGTDEEMSHFFNILGKDVSYDVLSCFPAELLGCKR
ncbi:hypothetical protein FRX31_006109, partial [Thalictrum thalictroides]